MRRRTLVFCLPVLAALAVTSSAQAGWRKSTELQPAEGYGVSDNYFGASFAVFGDRALVGSPGLEDTEAGRAYLFERQGRAWVQTEYWLSHDFDDDFGRAVALSTDTALVGAPDYQGKSGSVHVLEHDGSGWVHGNGFALATPVAGARFGSALAVSGETALAGAPGVQTVYVFERVQGVWVFAAELRPSGEAEEFGGSLAFDGTTALVGAPDDDAVYVFERTGSGLSSTWTEAARITRSGEGDEGKFGYALSLNGTSALIGAPGDEFEGKAYVYTKGAGGWNQTAVLSPFGAASDEEFGMSVAISADLALVGSPGDDYSQGATYVFRREGASWSEVEQLYPDVGPGEVNFGYNVAFHGQTIMVNVGLDDSPVFGIYSGAIHVWIPNVEKIRRELSQDLQSRSRGL